MCNGSLVLQTPVTCDFYSHTHFQSSVLCKLPSVCTAGDAAEWLSCCDALLASPAQQRCSRSAGNHLPAFRATLQNSSKEGAKPCTRTQSRCWQVDPQWVQLSWGGIWREQKPVAYGKDLWEKKQILMTLKLGEEACAEVYVVLRFWLTDKTPGRQWAWLCSLLDCVSTEGFPRVVGIIHVSLKPWHSLWESWLECNCSRCWYWVYSLKHLTGIDLQKTSFLLFTFIRSCWSGV